MRVLVIIGTRPEAIKLAPVIHTLRATDGIATIVCQTGQHDALLAPVMQDFGLQADVDCSAADNQAAPVDDGLARRVARMIRQLAGQIDTLRPSVVVVQGDTMTAFAGATAGYYSQTPVAHVEAGLRTGNSGHPWPEEVNRRLISQLAQIHFAPTAAAAAQLQAEGIAAGQIFMVGNTVVDALMWAGLHLRPGGQPACTARVKTLLPGWQDGQRLLLVTGHRRESWGQGLADICAALGRLAGRADVHIAAPVHLAPAVRQVFNDALAGHERISLLGPLGYAAFLDLLEASHFVITDSGGVQEEAPYFGKPCLITRQTTERPEVVDCGIGTLVGTQSSAIIAAANSLLDDAVVYARTARHLPLYGDGTASQQIAGVLRRQMSL